MAKLFYADCVISDIQIDAVTEHQQIVTARIDGREIKKLSVTEEMVRYFKGVGQGTQNRIWFYRVGLSGVTIIVAVENAAGERLERHTASAGMKFYDLVMRPVAIGFLFWFAAWVVLFIPVMGLGVRDSYDVINPIGIYGGIACGLWFSYKWMDLYKKLANLDAWAAGDLTRYTKAVKPKFGSGLAALKK